MEFCFLLQITYQLILIILVLIIIIIIILMTKQVFSIKMMQLLIFNNLSF